MKLICCSRVKLKSRPIIQKEEKTKERERHTERHEKRAAIGVAAAAAAAVGVRIHRCYVISSQGKESFIYFFFFACQQLH